MEWGPLVLTIAIHVAVATYPAGCFERLLATIPDHYRKLEPKWAWLGIVPVLNWLWFAFLVIIIAQCLKARMDEENRGIQSDFGLLRGILFVACFVVTGLLLDINFAWIPALLMFQWYLARMRELTSTA